MILSSENREGIVDSQISAQSDIISESDCIRGNMPRDVPGTSEMSVVANDGTRSKRRHVVRIVARRTLPRRSARVSSFSALENGDGTVDLPHMMFNKEGRITNSLPYLEPAEMLESDGVHDFGASTSAATTVTGDKMVPIETTNERHYLAHQLGDSVWPLLSQEAVDFSYAANVIVGMCQVPAEQICHSPPQKYTNTGTFVVDLSAFGNRHEIALDGLGVWGKPQGSSRYYKFVGAIPVKVPGLDGSDVKVLCNRYEHPGTRIERGRFIRKIMTGVNSSSGSPLPLAVVVYEWLGEPHPIQLKNMDSVEASRRPYGSRSWEVRNVDISRDEGLQFDGQPLYAKVAIDFGTVARIILGAEIIQPNRFSPPFSNQKCRFIQIHTKFDPPEMICTRVPQKYRAQGTFVVDVSKLENDSALRKDGNGNWGKPSGCSRYYKLTPHNEVIRIDRGQPLTDSTGDIQILSKRYENENSMGGSFVRKIYTGKTSGSRETQHLCALAVITYFWKGSTVPLIIDEDVLPQIGQNKRTYESTADEESGEGVCEGVPPRKIPDNGSDGKRYSANDICGMINETDVDEAHARVQRVSVRASNIWEGETPSLENLVLNHTDHLKRLTLAKELENQNRFAALLERAEQFLDRFEQASLNLGFSCGSEPQYVFDNSEMWESQPVENVANTVTVGGNTHDDEQSNEAEYLGTESERLNENSQSDFMQVHYQ